MDEHPSAKRLKLGDALRRLLDGRGEPRAAAGSRTAMLDHAGRRHLVRVGDVSLSGAMVACPVALAEGDQVVLHLLDHGPTTGQVRWSRDGRAGITFSKPLDRMLDDQ